MSEEKKHNHIMADNSGFTLVELLVSMAILGVVFIPILRSFMAATLTNSKAQKIQNATSVAQDVMEEVKSKRIVELMSDSRLDASDPILDLKDNALVDTNPGKAAYIHLKQTGVTNTQGEKFDVDVVIDARPYYQTPDATKGIIDANKKKLPILTNVDTDTCIALSGEINRYDVTAVDTLYMRFADGTITKDIICENGIKTIEIDITDPTDVSRPMSEYKCNVTYSINSESITYLVQSGTVTNKVLATGPDVYLFYSMMADCATDYLGSEKIVIKKNDTSIRTHKLNLIMQHNRLYAGAVPGSASAADPSLKSILDALSMSGDFSVSFMTGSTTNSTENMKGNASFGGTFVSNIIVNGSSMPDNTPMYSSHEKIRLYDVIVTVKQGGVEKAKVQSTMEAK